MIGNNSLRVSLTFLVTALVFAVGVGILTTVRPMSQILRTDNPSIVFLEISFRAEIPYREADGQISVTTVSSSGSCSGSFIDDQGTILTAKHCTDMARAARVIAESHTDPTIPYDDMTMSAPTLPVSDVRNLTRTIQVTQSRAVTDPAVPTPTEATVLVEGSSTTAEDVAVLRVRIQNETVPLAVATAAPAIGDELYAVGFPGVNTWDALNGMSSTDTPIEQFADSMVSPSFRHVWVTGQHFKDGITTVTVSNGLQPGMSGGPVLNRNGEVVAVNSAIFLDGYEGIVTSLDDTLRSLVQAQADIYPASVFGISLWRVGLALVGIAILMAILGIYFTRNVQRNANTPMEVEAPTSVQPVSQYPSTLWANPHPSYQYQAYPPAQQPADQPVQADPVRNTN